ncbi:MAG: ComF family protein [Burkholderiaceae bacterium]|nr:MAG: ComF family protein [Burkholderiaceae bacterium]
MIFRHLINAGLDAALPLRCAICQSTSSTAICHGCHADFIHSNSRRCQQCALPLNTQTSHSICGDCIKHQPSYDTTIAATDYQAPCDHLIQRLKFSSELRLAHAMAQAIRNCILAAEQKDLPDLLIPVPLGHRRLQERGFNQAFEIGRQLSKQLGIRIEADLMIRKKETLAQSTLGPQQRRTNMRNAFLCGDSFRTQIQGLHIGVIDDVMTTGMTLNAIAKELKFCGARKVSNFIFARTPKTI